MAIDATSFPSAPAGPPRGHDPILESAYLAHAAGLRGRLLSMTRDPALADDLVGEAFLRLALEIDAGRTPRDVPAWLYRVGKNLLISRARRASVATRALPALFERDHAPSPEDEIVTRERDRELHDLVASLGGVDRTVVVLAAQGYRTEEIARLIGSTGAATRTRLCRARGRLRVRLELAGLTA
jgi:RNA polymerase sigma factor (sigma-70 family)